MRGKAIFAGSRRASNRHIRCVLASLLSLAVICISGCSMEELSSHEAPSLPNAVAVDRALQLCSLTRGDQPFHLVLEISPPSMSNSSGEKGHGGLTRPEMRAQVEIYWLNTITYRTIIRSPKFSQVRTVNGNVIDEHNTGDFYPRWIQNFVDALLDPIPKAAVLRKLPGSVPVSRQSHACITNPSDEVTASQVCFQDAEPRLASGLDFTRYVSFDDFEPFGSQQIPRTLINDLPANFLVRGHITLLEPLPQSAYKILKAREFTSPERQIRTTLVSRSMAQSLMESAPETRFFSPHMRRRARLIAYSPESRDARTDQTTPGQSASPESHIIIYVRTDRTGRVREAYRDSADIYGLHNEAVARALMYKFRPLLINGVPQQMEAPLELP